MSGRNLRARLADDPALGTGNVLSTLVGYGSGRDTPTLTFDSDVDGHRAGESLSLAELERCVAARAGWLRAHGIGPRDVVAVYSSVAADMVLGFLALTRIGAIAALVNGNLDGATAATYISRLRATGVLTDEAHRPLLVAHDPGTDLLGDTAELGGGDPALGTTPYRHHRDDPVSLTHSSGTTGIPKAVLHTHATLFAANRNRLRLPRAQGVDRMLSALPAAHAATLIAVNLALCNQAEFFPLSKQSGAAVLDAIEHWRPSGVFGFAATWADMANIDLSTRDLDSVGLWWNTGDCAHEAHIRKLIGVGNHAVATAQGVVRKPGSRLIDGLGTSELGQSPFFITHGPGTTRYGRCIGKPHVHAKVAVLGPDGDELPPGEVGLLGVQAESITPGYWNDSVSTYRSKLAGYFLPGDLVFRDEEGFYYHLDRATDAVDLGDGKRLYTAMSEERVLTAIADIADCTVIAFQTDGKAVVDVLLRLAPDADPELDRTQAVLSALGEAAAAAVRRVTVVPAGDIPTGPTGKVRKVALRERHAELTAAGTP
ncbi:class I adenylate-forming enzyme family protein [Actinokineospora sp.]|uniref:class I adenylate-forming enzyme family protein n=1 Tax=Actinokineospora sp. TaxID=1872133 RepID=UPI004037C0CE